MFNIKSLCYDIYVVKSYPGSIAQPGERSPHTREVTGSSPVASISVPFMKGLIFLHKLCLGS